MVSDVVWDKLDSPGGDLWTPGSEVIKTTTVVAGLRHLVVVLCQMVEGVTERTAQFPPSYAGPVLAQLLAVDPLTEVSQMVEGAAPAALKLPCPAHSIGAVLLAVRTAGTEMTEGGALVALVPTTEGIAGVGPVGLTVGTLLQSVISLAALLAPPAFSWCGGARDNPGLH